MLLFANQVLKMILALLLLVFPRLAPADSQWILEESTLTYHVSHPLHQTEGVSHAAKGKGVCHDGQCDFLIAVPVKSFDSGDSNRDLHMLQVVRGGQFPLITVRTHLPESASSLETIQADLEVLVAVAVRRLVSLSRAISQPIPRNRCPVIARWRDASARRSERGQHR